MERGELRKGRQDVVIVLRARFREVPASVHDALERIEDVARLDGLLEDAARAESLEEFERQLAG